MNTSTYTHADNRDQNLRLLLLAGVVFLGWKALRGLSSLFWTAFGIGWILFWTQSWRWL